MSKFEFKDQENGHGIDLPKMFINSFIDISKPISRQPVAISIGTSTYKQNLYPIPFGSYGDYSCIVGASKSKKSFLKSAIMAGYIGGRANNYFPDIKGHNTNGKYVIDIDTEQSKYHSQRVFKRVIEMVGHDYDYYRPFSIREYSAPERLEFIDWIINESEYRGKIGLISIDGYADLVNNFNDVDESNKLQQKLLNWTTSGNLHMTGILHKNFGSEKPVGHIGSAVMKKSETVVFVESDVDGVSVECRLSRNLPFNNFRFDVGPDWLPKEMGNEFKVANNSKSDIF